MSLPEKTKPYPPCPPAMVLKVYGATAEEAARNVRRAVEAMNRVTKGVGIQTDGMGLSDDED